MSLESQIYRDLSYLMPRGFDLPPIEFFKPTQAFIEWMAQTLTGELVYDVGAGTGLCASKLQRAGVSVVALDHHHRTKEHCKIIIADGATFPYEPSSTVMLCRPCHGFFVGAVIEQAIYSSARRVLYVGLPHNRKGDLGEYSRHFKRVLTRAGESGECVYEMVNL